MQNSCPIIIPEVSEVRLNFVSQLMLDVTRLIWFFVTHQFLDHDEPALKFVFLRMQIINPHWEDNLNEVVHQNREESDSKNLYDASNNLLTDWTWVVITITHSGQCR